MNLLHENGFKSYVSITQMLASCKTAPLIIHKVLQLQNMLVFNNQLVSCTPMDSLNKPVLVVLKHHSCMGSDASDLFPFFKCSADWSKPMCGIFVLWSGIFTGASDFISLCRECGAETFVNFASFERDGKMPYNW